MKTIAFIVITMAVVLTGCGKTEPESEPVTQVNAPQPTNIVTNLPPAK
jgi:predicted small lipoprotein YifL